MSTPQSSTRVVVGGGAAMILNAFAR